MKNFDHQARSNVLGKIMAMMGEQMAGRTPQGGKTLHVQIKHGSEPEPASPKGSEECPHCDGEGCRFCK